MDDVVMEDVRVRVESGTAVQPTTPAGPGVDDPVGAASGAGAAAGEGGGGVGDPVEVLRKALGILAAQDRSGWSGPARAGLLENLVGVRERLDALIVQVCAEWDRTRTWETEGAGSATSWLAGRTGLGRRDAAGLVRAARLVDRHRQVGEALTAGQVRVAQVGELARAARRFPDPFAEQAGELVGIATRLGVDDFTLVMRRWTLLADDLAGGHGTDRAIRRRHLSVTHGPWGNLLGAFDLDPEGGALVLGTLDRYVRDMWTPAHQRERPSLAQRRADALVELCRTTTACDTPHPGREPGHDHEPDPAPRHDPAPGHGPAPGHDHEPGEDPATGEHRASGQDPEPDHDPAPGDSPAVPTGPDPRSARRAYPTRPVSIEVLVDLDTYTRHPTTDPAAARCDILGYGPVPPATIRRLACDTRLGLLLTHRNRPLAASRQVRYPTPTQRRAVLARDQGCVIHGCGLPAHWCDLHHLQPYQHGGPTDPDNLITLCRRHHLACHELHHTPTRDHHGHWHLQPDPHHPPPDPPDPP